jgi:hypothetical protein
MLSATKRLKRRVWYPARHGLRALRWPDHARVDFVVAGAQKSGTTALDSYLRQHPNLQMALVKEAHFFDDERVFRSRDPAWWTYHSLFPPYEPQKLFGETTPIYMYWEPAFPRIARYNRDMRILMILRNPIERAYSHWAMSVRHGREKLPFREAIVREAERLRHAGQSRRFSYLSRGFYSKQVRRALRHFPRSQVLAVRHDALRHEPQATMNAVFRFLGVERIRIHPRRMHAGSYAPMAEADRRLLSRLYADEIRELERLLGWNCASWLRHDRTRHPEPAL